MFGYQAFADGVSEAICVKLLLSQLNMTGSVGPLSPGERVGVRDSACESGLYGNHPLPRGEGVNPPTIGRILLTH